MAIYRIDESDTRLGPNPGKNADVIPRSALVSNNKLELRRENPRPDVPNGATEVIGNNQGPDGADVDIYGVRLREGDILRINVNDVNANTVDHLVRIFGEGANAAERAKFTGDTFDFIAPRTGNFFIAVSAKGNGQYNPDAIQYGNGRTDRRVPPNNDNPTGAFEIELELVTAPPPSVSISDAIATEGQLLTFTVSLSGASTVPISVDVSPAGGTAIANQDYTPTTSTITFNPGETSKTVSISTTDDNIVEGSETIEVNLQNPTGGATIGDGQGVGTIQDNDTAIVSITPSPSSSSPIPEGDSGTTPVNFSITLSNPVDIPITVDYSTADSSATVADNDYQPVSGSVTFNPGEQAKPIPTININGDTAVESDEVFNVNLSNLQAGGRPVSLGNSASVTIENDDLPPNVSISVDQTVIAENGGQAKISASLDRPANQDVVVELELDGEAIALDDYVLTTPTTITIPKGQTIGSTTVDITATDDFIDEMAGEAIDITLKSAINANISGNQTLSVFITDDDTAGITLVESDGNTAVTEGGQNDTYTLVLDSQPTSNVTISITPDGQLTLDQSTITFNPSNWDQPQTITVTAVDDTVLEGDHSGLITHTASSADVKYDGMPIPNVDVAIEDVYNVMFVGRGGEGNETPIDKRLRSELDAKFGNIDAVNLQTVDDDAVQNLDTDLINQQDLIIISESVASKKVGDTFADVRGGVMTWESHLFDDLGMTGVGGSNSNPMHPGQDVNYGFVKNAKQIEIIDPSHPLAAGLSGTVDVYNRNSRISWGLVNNAATVVATLPNDSDKATIFAYEAGVTMAGGIESNGNRLGFFLHNHGEKPNNLTPEAISLFNAAVDYMVG